MLYNHANVYACNRNHVLSIEGGNACILLLCIFMLVDDDIHNIYIYACKCSIMSTSL